MDQNNKENICRTCLSSSGEFQSVFITVMNESSGLETNLSEMITSFASIQIAIDDGLPEEICSDCAEKAVSLYLFRQKCEESDSILRNKLAESAANEPDLEIKTIDEIPIKPEISVEEHEIVLTIEESNKPATESKESDGEYKCDLCPSEFATKSMLNRHLRTHSDTKSTKEHECPTCNKRFSRNDLLLRHKIAHAMKMNNNAKMKFDELDDNDDEFADAIIIKTESDLYPCAKCNLLFMSKMEQEDHSKWHSTRKKKFGCNICGSRFAKQSHLNMHIPVHSEKKPFICSTCNKGFYKLEHYNNHINVHSGTKPHTCEICCKGFNQISNLKDHMRTHSGEKPFLCSTCGKGFNQLGNLRQHTVRHSGIKAHLCSTCGSGFASKGELSAHLRKHTGARPFVCPVCKNGFTTSSSLTKHKRIHSGEKPYECDVCKMKFSRSGILARHKRTHTGEKPYTCKYCSKAFTQSNDLTSHLRIHTGEKPFICDACGQAFRQSSALKTHKKTHIDRAGMVESKHNVVKVVQATTAFITDCKFEN